VPARAAGATVGPAGHALMRAAPAPDPGEAVPARRLAEVLPLGRGGRAPGAAPAPRLPAFAASLVGRRQEVAEVAELVGSHRLVTLSGPGGVGKTRLAVEAAGRLADRRTYFVDLSLLRGGHQVPETIALALGVGELRGRELAGLLAGVEAGEALVVLDNCEHVVAACADVARQILERCPSLHILATSQQRLGVTGERVFPVPPLALPEPGTPATLEGAMGSPAVELFCQRAGAVRGGRIASAADLDAIADVCRRLEGNPLAIELAAARADVLPVADIAARLHRHLDVLRTTTPPGPPRQQTLAAALAWSHDLLSPSERILLRRLSVFAGGFSLGAAEAVCVGGEVDRHGILDLLGGLVAKSLVLADTGAAVARYRLVGTVQHFAGNRLVAAGEAAQVSLGHARWYAEWIEARTAAGGGAAWPAAHRVEADNVRSALEWCVAEGQAELALHLAAGLMGFWESTGRFAEAREQLERVLTLASSAPAVLQAAAHHDTGFAAFMVGDFDAARDHLQQALGAWARTGDAEGAARTQGLLAFVSTLGDGRTRVDDLERDAERLRASGDGRRLGEALLACGHARLFRGEPAAAVLHFREVVAAARRRGDEVMATTALVGLGTAELGRGDYRAAERTLGEGVGLAGELGQSHAEAVGLVGLAELARRRGGGDQARSRFEACLARARALGAPYPLARSLIGLGRVLVDAGVPGEAGAHFEEAASLGRSSGLAHLVAAALDGLGQVAAAAGDAGTARARFEAAHQSALGCGDQASGADATFHLAALARAEGDLDQASARHGDALHQRHACGDRAGVADSLEALASLALARGSGDVAARLLAAAGAQRKALGAARAPGANPAQARLATQLVPEDFRRAWEQGAALSADDAVAYATKGRVPAHRPPAGGRPTLRT